MTAQTSTLARLAGAANGNEVVARRARYRAEDVTFLAEQGADLHEVVRRMHFPSRDALWVFCKRQGIRDVYLSMARRTYTEQRFAQCGAGTNRNKHLHRVA